MHTVLRMMHKKQQGHKRKRRFIILANLCLVHSLPVSCKPSIVHAARCNTVLRSSVAGPTHTCMLGSNTYNNVLNTTPH